MNNLFLLFFLITNLFSQNYFLSNPSISPNGNNISFHYKGDLWEVSTENLVAERLYSVNKEKMASLSQAIYSPDGKYIGFFISNEKNELYLYNRTNSQFNVLVQSRSSFSPLSWSWDSQKLLVKSFSFLDIAQKIYSFDITKKEEKPLFQNIFTKMNEWCQLPNGDAIFTANKQRNDQKGYRGSQNSNLNYYSVKNDCIYPITSYTGNDLMPRSDKNGHIYFLSDRSNGYFNIHRLDSAFSAIPITNEKFHIKHFNISANGEALVYEMNYELYLKKLKNDKAEKLKIIFKEYDRPDFPQTFNLDENIHQFDVSEKTEKLVVQSNGNVFIKDSKAAFSILELRELKNVDEVIWLTDNQIAYNKQIDGFLNLFIYDLKLKKETQLTRTNDHYLKLQQHKNYIYCFRGTKELLEINTKTGKIRTLASDLKIQANYMSDISINEAGTKLSFDMNIKSERDIFVYDLTKNILSNITTSVITEHHPQFNLDNDLIFLSDRTKNSYNMDNIESIYKISTKQHSVPNVLFKSDKNFSDLFVLGNYVFSIREKHLILHGEKELSSSYKVNNLNLKLKNNKIYALCDKKLYTIDPSNLERTPLSFNLKYAMSYKEFYKKTFYKIYADYAQYYYEEDFSTQEWEKKKEHYEVYLNDLHNRYDFSILVQDFISELRSSHTSFRSYDSAMFPRESYQNYTTGILYSTTKPYKVKELLSGFSAEKSGIKIGDELVAVNSNLIKQNEHIASYFSFPVNPEVIDLTFKRKNEIKKYALQAKSIFAIEGLKEINQSKINQEKVERLSSQKIAYHKIKSMSNKDFEHFREFYFTEFHKKEATILDIRGNEGGNIHHKLLDLILEAKPFMNWNLRNNNIFTAPNFSSEKKIVLLVDEHTESDAEIFTLLMKELKLATVIGNTTGGICKYQYEESDDIGSTWSIPYRGITDLNGRDLEKNGVDPDILVKNTIQDKYKNRDPQLNAAIKFLMDRLKKSGGK
jgi:tricorn protease